MPEKGIHCLAKAIVVKDTTRSVLNKLLTIIIPSSDRQDADKLLEIGEVIQVGSKVSDEIKVGDLVLYRRIAAFYIPNGIDKPYLWTFDQFAVVAKIDDSNDSSTV